MPRDKELRAEIKTLEYYKRANPLSSEDAAQVSEFYQKRLEINWQLSDLYDELDSLTEPDDNQEPELEYPQ